MGRRWAIMGLVALCAACSSHDDRAVESPASAVQAKGDALGAWLEGIRRDAGVLEALNDFGGAGAQNAPGSDVCADADVRAALEKRQGHAPVLNAVRGDFAKGLEILEGVPATGSTHAVQHLDEIRSLVASSASEAQASFAWEDADMAALSGSLRQAGFDPARPDARDAFVQALKGDNCQSILPRYCAFAQKARGDSAAQARGVARLDAMLTCELARWAGALRLNYPANDYKFDRFRKYVSDAAIVSIRKETFIEDMARRGVEAAFARIEPPHPQYRALVASRQVYLDAIEAGGWPKVAEPAKIAEPVIGRSYPYVPALRERLKAERYDVGDDTSDVFDQKLLDAVNLYKELHQLATKKLIDKVLFKNLAVSPQERLEVIDLAAQKYRELAVGSLQYYVMVNIPDFYVEVWKDGKRERRQRIVVGNDKVQIDPVTKRQVPDPETLYPLHPNRTPIQTSKINEIILNPYWNVPARIRIEELEPHLAENPNYYAENNYEEVNVDNPKLYYVRELPNPKNSLGQVKFMFPNPHNTYLHDTPAKAVFKLPTRAFSHGCMRVQNPLALAELLLKHDGQWDAGKFKSILTTQPLEQVTIELKRPVDVDVVYINARVDDAGPVAFLSDVYHYDAVRTGKLVLKKLPKPKDMN